VEQNEKLTSKVSKLERKLAESRAESEAKDRAIMELAALVDI